MLSYFTALEKSPFACVSAEAIGCGVEAPGSRGLLLKDFEKDFGLETREAASFVAEASVPGSFLSLRVEPIETLVHRAFRSLSHRQTKKKAERWNTLFEAFLATSYIDFRDFVCGRYYSEEAGQRIVLKPPSADCVRVPARVLKQKLSVFEEEPFAPFVFRENQRKLRALVHTHLRPFASVGFSAEGLKRG